MREILKTSHQTATPEYRCADAFAEKRILEISRLRGRYLGHTKPTFPGRVVRR